MALSTIISFAETVIYTNYYVYLTILMAYFNMLRAHKRWVALAPEILENDVHARLPADKLYSDLPELRVRQCFIILY